jgi:hypothetical protein
MTHSWLLYLSATHGTTEEDTLATRKKLRQSRESQSAPSEFLK